VTRILKIFILLAFVSCQDKSSADKKATPDKYGWEIVKIYVNDNSLWVPLREDTCFYTEYTSDTAYARQNSGQKKSIMTKFVVSKIQKDSILMLAEDAIKNHNETTQTVSDYAGQSVTITLWQYNSSLTCKYSSISDWTRISPTLAKLSRLTYGQVQKTK